jgi:hypothetical protein
MGICCSSRESNRVVEDTTLFTGEHFELKGEMDEDTKQWQGKVFGMMKEAGVDLSKEETIVEGVRNMMELLVKATDPAKLAVYSD